MFFHWIQHSVSFSASFQDVWFDLALAAEVEEPPIDYTDCLGVLQRSSVVGRVQVPPHCFWQQAHHTQTLSTRWRLRKMSEKCQEMKRMCDFPLSRRLLEVEA